MGMMDGIIVQVVELTLGPLSFPKLRLISRGSKAQPSNYMAGGSGMVSPHPKAVGWLAPP